MKCVGGGIVGGQVADFGSHLGLGAGAYSVPAVLPVPDRSP